MNDERWYDLTLPDGTPLLAYDAVVSVDAGALRLEVTLESASAELLAESDVFGALHLPSDPALELQLALVMSTPDPELTAVLAAAEADPIAVLTGPLGARAHRVDAFELVDAVAVLPDAIDV